MEDFRVEVLFFDDGDFLWSLEGFKCGGGWLRDRKEVFLVE